jgi:hypothetical protein
MQLAGTEQIHIETNFSSNPIGLSTDHKIDALIFLNVSTANYKGFP